uniref:Uncharacterized protein n=2 Tax=Haemonchus contortus TaxID=6289 RepID=A0A7I4YFI4_HAECO
MTGFTDLVRRNMPPPLPPRLCGSMKPTCFCQPSSSKKCPPKQEVVENADSFDLFPHRLANPSSDFDTDSLGFVDIEELRKLEELECASVISVPVLPKTAERTSFATLRKWIPRQRCKTSHGYDNLGTAIEYPVQSRSRELCRPRKVLRSLSTSSVVLPFPSKKRSFRGTLRKLVFCGSR